jgi:hypothetical protein
MIYKKIFKLKKLNLSKTFKYLLDLIKEEKRIMKDYKIKHELFFFFKNLTQEEQNIAKAIFIIKDKKVISQFIPDVSHQRYLF